tara:strand:+ start:632 stop:988 length:357 start_codon:yes stop_codon:yes gene_type:complete
MAHFAQLDSNNVVTNVIVVDNSDIVDGNGDESEAIGIQFCVNLLGGTWKQTSYNGNIRKNYAAIGYTYDSTKDAFIPPKPFNSWTLNETTCIWEAPTSYPDDGNIYYWDEDTTSWVVG